MTLKSPKICPFVMLCYVCKPNDYLTYCNNPNLFFYFVLLPAVELHVCVVYLLRKSEYSCCFLSMQFGFGCKTMDIELLFSCFNCTFCEFHTALFSYLFLNQKRHFSIKLLKIYPCVWCHWAHSGSDSSGGGADLRRVNIVTEEGVH